MRPLTRYVAAVLAGSLVLSLFAFLPGGPAHPLQVLAAENRGRGLFATRRFETGDILPLSYGGKTISVEMYDELVAAASDPKSTVADLRERGLSVCSRASVSRCIPLPAGETLDHGAVLAFVQQYAFLMRQVRGVDADWSLSDREALLLQGGDKTACVLWPECTADGRMIADQVDALFINEPPPGRAVNVETEDQGDGSVLYRAARPIGPGDELFTCYGKGYKRSYSVNMDRSDGCGLYN